MQYGTIDQRERKKDYEWLPLFVCSIPGQDNECYRRADNARGDADEEREVDDVFEEPGDGEHDDDEDRDGNYDSQCDIRDSSQHFGFLSVYNIQDD